MQQFHTKFYDNLNWWELKKINTRNKNGMTRFIDLQNNNPYSCNVIQFIVFGIGNIKGYLVPHLAIVLIHKLETWDVMLYGYKYYLIFTCY